MQSQWHDSNGDLRHLIAEIKRPDGEDVIVSKRWRKVKQRWALHAETRSDVDFQIKLQKGEFDDLQT